MKERKLKINFDDISNNEKRHLKSRITNSIHSYIQKKRRLRYGISVAAASVVILLSIGIFNNVINKDSQIENFVKTLDKSNPESIQTVKLLLNDDQNIEIADTNASISYSSTGEEVTIGDLESVSQKSTKNKAIAFNTLIVPYGKRSEIKLADGSKVWLNSGSKLVFPVSFVGDRREVYLEGEAIFEVSHDANHPFIVKANNHEIEVLGTVFNVSNYIDENTINTVLKSGSVQINFDNGSFLSSSKSIKIKPGTMAMYHRHQKSVTASKVDVEKHFSWRTGIFIFKKDPLDVIMKKISRYYNIDIIINDEVLANETFSGYLDVKDNVENVINSIKETTDFQYSINENKILINKN